ncbi:peptidoglycan-binding protein [Synechococcus sp. BSF8S]|nr:MULTISPECIES: peptidoglycan-binding domain-containing protein [unclassified Synechococcus]
MANLQQGEQGPAVGALQNQLIQLGFLFGVVDEDFGPATAQAVRDFQRRVPLRPDAIVGSRTAAALSQALGSSPPFPTSPFRQLRQDAAASGANDDKLPGLDRGFNTSPFQDQLPGFANALSATPDAVTTLSYPVSPATFQPYPTIGQIPQVLEGRDGRGGLEFLSDEVAQACVAVGGFQQGSPLRVRWYGRQASGLNVQFWSATKFAAALQLICQANRLQPTLPIDRCDVVGERSGASRRESFGDLFTEMVSYSKGVPHSNAVAWMLKQIRSPGQPDLQSWLRSITGNAALRLNGPYGEGAYLIGARLVGPAGILVPHLDLERTRNILSAYDLTRLLTMLGWHRHLSTDQQLPGAQWSSLTTAIRSLAHDTARYVDIAIERLGLINQVQAPVVLSKLGFGTTAPGFPEAPALTYAAFAQFIDTRSTPGRQRSVALVLRIPTGQGDGPRHDARMATEVTEILRRLFAEEFR